MAGQQPALFIQIAALFSIPALVAAGLVAATGQGETWQAPVLFLLQSLTTVVAPVVFMMAVSAVHEGERASAWRVTRRALPWLPRYLWTNAHTSVVFWVPVGTLLLLPGLVDGVGEPPGLLGAAMSFLWPLALLLLAVFLHSRTVLAPFLAVHGDLPGTLAAWESWRLSRRHFPIVVSTLLVSSLPSGLPIALLAGPIAAGVIPWPADPEVLPQLTGVALQLVRLTLVPAMYLLYCDLWQGMDRDRVAQDLPGPIGALLALSTGRPPATFRNGPLEMELSNGAGITAGHQPVPVTAVAGEPRAYLGPIRGDQ